MDLFKLLGTIAINNTDANQALDEISHKAQDVGGKMQEFGSKVSEVGMTLTKKLTAPIAAAGTATFLFAKKTASAGDRIDKLSQKIGISRQAFQELDFICSQSGTSVETLQMGIKSLTAQMDGATSGTKSAVERFEKLGVAVTNADGSMRSQEEVMWDTMTALQGVENQTEKARLATELFGRSGTELMPLLNGEAGSIDEMKKKAHELGLVLDDEAVDASVEFTDKMDQLRRSLTAAGQRIGVAILPIITSLADAFMEKCVPAIIAFTNKARSIISWIHTAHPQLLNTGLAILGIAAAIGPVLLAGGKLISLVGGLIGNFGKFAKALKAAITVLTANPILLVITGLIAAFVLLYKNSEKFRTAVQNLGSQVKSSLQPAFKALQQVFAALKPLLSELMGIFGSLCTTLGNVLAPIIKALSPLVAKVFAMMANQVKSKLKIVIVAIKGLTAGAKLVNKYLVQPIEKAAKKVGAAIKKIQKAFKSLKIKFPKFKVPELYIKWKGANKISKALGLKGMPSIAVKWHAKGGIFKQPTLLQSQTGQMHGVGEAGAEAITPISELKTYVAEAVSGQMAAMLNGLKEIEAARAYTFNLATVVDGRQIAISTAKYTQEQLNKLQQRQDRMAGVRA